MRLLGAWPPLLYMCVVVGGSIGSVIAARPGVSTASVAIPRVLTAIKRHYYLDTIRFPTDAGSLRKLQRKFEVAMAETITTASKPIVSTVKLYVMEMVCFFL